MKRCLAAILAAVLILCCAAYASGEPSDETASAEIPQTEFISAEDETEVTEELLSAADAEEITVTDEEIPAPEEAPVADEDPFPGFDPDDPMYAEMLDRLENPVTDGKSFSDYSHRTLNNETIVYGIDVSAWQGSIDWAAVKASGVQYVFIRAAYRGTGTGVLGKDGRFEGYIQGAKAAGLLVGVYIYSQAITTEEAREEARYLMDLCSGYSLDLPYVLDFEYYGTSGRLYKADLSRQAATDICLAFCNEIESNNHDSMVYANANMLSSHLYASQLGRVWLAHFTTKTSYSGSYEYWQCGYGTVSGVSGDVDMDFWYRPQVTETYTFSDVTENDWFYDTVMSAYDLGIVRGITDSTFGPGQSASRAQTVTMLYRMAGSPASDSFETTFTDLTQTYYQAAVAWAVKNGIVNGVSDTSFAPDRAITREELVTILYRMAGGRQQTGSLSDYTDAASVHEYAQQAMLWAVKNSIITGYTDGTLNPRGSATRAEVCTILMRFEQLSGA